MLFRSAGQAAEGVGSAAVGRGDGAGVEGDRDAGERGAVDGNRSGEGMIEQGGREVRAGQVRAGGSFGSVVPS